MSQIMFFFFCFVFFFFMGGGGGGLYLIQPNISMGFCEQLLKLIFCPDLLITFEV